MRAGSDLEAQGLALRTRLRFSSLLGLTAGGLVFLVDVYSRRSAMFSALAVVYGIHLAIVAVGLGASMLALSEPALDRIMIFLVVAYLGNTLAYLHLWPREAMLVAQGVVTILMVSAVLFLWPVRRVLVVALLGCAGFLVVGMIAPSSPDALPFALAAGPLLAGATIAVASARALDRFRASLADRERELADLSTRLMSAQEEERRRISRELHDELGQSLTAINAHLWLVERGLPDSTPLREQTGEARRLLARTTAAMRELSHLLRPSVLDEFGLVPSLDSHLRTFTERHGIITHFETRELPERLPPATETALYRITQEALTNVVRHAHAQHVRVEMVAADGELRLVIEDDGVGLTRPEVRDGHGGTGLVGIRERVRALGGTVAIHAPKGLRLDIRLPLRSA